MDTTVPWLLHISQLILRHPSVFIDAANLEIFDHKFGPRHFQRMSFSCTLCTIHTLSQKPEDAFMSEIEMRE